MIFFTRMLWPCRLPEVPEVVARGARAAMDMAFVATRHGHRLKFSCYTQNSKQKNVVRHGFYVMLHMFLYARWKNARVLFQHHWFQLASNWMIGMTRYDPFCHNPTTPCTRHCNIGTKALSRVINFGRGWQFHHFDGFILPFPSLANPFFRKLEVSLGGSNATTSNSCQAITYSFPSYNVITFVLSLSVCPGFLLFPEKLLWFLSPFHCSKVWQLFCPHQHPCQSTIKHD